MTLRGPVRSAAPLPALAPKLLPIIPVILLAACQTEPTPMVAAPPPPASIARLYERPAERALVSGIRLYDEGTMDRAEMAFKTALGAGLQNPHDVAVAHKYLAFIGCAFNRLPECEQSFRDAIAADRTFRLSDAEIGHPIWGPVYKRVLASPPTAAPPLPPAAAPSSPPAPAPPHSALPAPALLASLAGAGRDRSAWQVDAPSAVRGWRVYQPLAQAPMLDFSPGKNRAATMAGHSKWANIQHRKNRQDAKRGQLWTKIIREVTVAARAGGGDATMNPRLRLALEKASAGNVPKDTVNKAIQRGAGKLDGAIYEEIRYEGYGIGGAAVIVDCMTDNRTRTVAEVRHAFAKHGGNMGAEGSVAFQFRHCGQLLFAPGTSEERVMEIALEAGADDVISDQDGTIEVLCPVAEFPAVKDALERAGLRPEMADLTMKPLNEIVLRGDDAQKMQRLLEVLEDLDDVQQVFASAALADA